MPLLERAGAPSLHYVIDDYTDPWEKKPWMVLQHGYSRSGVFFRQWVPYLARHYRIVRPDIRGLGQSPLEFDPATGISADALLSDLNAIFDMIGEPVHYVGESLGGILGVVLASTVPQKLRSLTMLASPLTIPKATQEAFACGYESWQVALKTLGSRGWSEKVNSATRFPPDADPRLVAWYAEECGKSNVDVLIALSLVARSIDVGPYLPKVAVPTLGLYPTAGTVTRFEEQKIREGIKGIRVVNLPTPAHAIQVLMPGECAMALRHFCGLVDGTPNFG
ncbi:MAG: alpha/beta fold hydrolase [Hyphomicrobiaceae bacterium]